MFTLVVVIEGHHFAPTPETTSRHFEETVRLSSPPSPHQGKQLLPTPRGRSRICSYRKLIESRSPEATDKSLMQKKCMPYGQGRLNTSTICATSTISKHGTPYFCEARYFRFKNQLKSVDADLILSSR